MADRTLEERIYELERDLEAERKARKKLEDRADPIFKFWDAGTLLGRIVWIGGGALLVIVTIWSNVWGFFNHTAR